MNFYETFSVDEAVTAAMNSANPLSRLAHLVWMKDITQEEAVRYYREATGRDYEEDSQ